MDKKPTGGQAFPMPSGPNNFNIEGMTLRDYFAAKTLQGLVSHPNYDGEMCHNAVKESYLMADAMLRERVK